MQALKIIRRDAEELKTELGAMYSFEKAVAHFMQKYDSELTEADYNQLGIIHKKIKELAPHLK